MLSFFTYNDSNHEVMMKSALLIMSLFLSTQAFSGSFIFSTAMSSLNVCKEAAQTIDDAQNFYISGALSASLAQKINDLKTLNKDLSTEEALSLIVENAENTLAENSKE